MTIGVALIEPALVDREAQGLVAAQDAGGQIVQGLVPQAGQGGGVKGGLDHHVTEQIQQLGQIGVQGPGAQGHDLLVHPHRDVGAQPIEQGIDGVGTAVQGAALAQEAGGQGRHTLLAGGIVGAAGAHHDHDVGGRRRPRLTHQGHRPLGLGQGGNPGVGRPAAQGERQRQNGHQERLHGASPVRAAGSATGGSGVEGWLTRGLGRGAGVPWFLGGSADLAPSTMTLVPEAGSFAATHFSGRNMHFGIREHGMAAACNGMALSGLRPYCATFFVFFDYLKPALRLSALGQLGGGRQGRHLFAQNRLDPRGIGAFGQGGPDHEQPRRAGVGPGHPQLPHQPLLLHQAAVQRGHLCPQQISEDLHSGPIFASRNEGGQPPAKGQPGIGRAASPGLGQAPQAVLGGLDGQGRPGLLAPRAGPPPVGGAHQVQARVGRDISSDDESGAFGPVVGVEEGRHPHKAIGHGRHIRVGADDGVVVGVLPESSPIERVPGGGVRVGLALSVLTLHRAGLAAHLGLHQVQVGEAIGLDGQQIRQAAGGGEGVVDGVVLGGPGVLVHPQLQQAALPLVGGQGL